MSPSQITAFDELQADFKVPIDQGNPLHAVSFLPGRRVVGVARDSLSFRLASDLRGFPLAWTLPLGANARSIDRMCGFG